MRAHTNLRTAFRFTMMMVAATGVTFAASQAHADTAGAVGGTNSSTGSAALKFEMAQGLDTSIDTGFLGPAAAQVRAVVKIDPVKDGGPLYAVDMPKGAVMTIPALWSFAKDWYGSSLKAPWRKRSLEATRALFARHGLVSDFWAI